MLGLSSRLQGRPPRIREHFIKRDADVGIKGCKSAKDVEIDDVLAEMAAFDDKNSSRPTNQLTE